MKSLLCIIIVLLNLSCGNSTQTDQESKIITLKGNLNEEKNYWTSQDEGYENAIFRNDSEYAIITSVNGNGESGNMGLINKKGELIIPAKFYGLMAGFDKNGFNKVKQNGKSGLYNKDGEQILNPEFDSVYEDLDLSQGLIKVTNNKLSGLVNFKGEIVIPIKYPALGEPAKNLIPFMSEPSKWGYLNFKDEVILKPQFSTTSLGENGEAIAHRNGENFIVSENGDLKKID